MTNSTRQREPLTNLILYHLFKWSVVSPAFNIYFRGKLYGRENVPQKGPLVVVSNHASLFDPPLLSCCVGRPVAYMAKEELFQIPVLKQAISLYGAYPVKRSQADRSAIRAALKTLEQGWAAGLFLQGTRTADGRITQPKLGAAMIAAKAQAPILPVSLWGTEKIPQSGTPFPLITARIAEPLAPPVSTKREVLEAVTQKCAEIINTMHAQGR
ncbi:MAG: 1-acylglycerol-3-phosphate O-acyltransferase [Cyanobacteria bacterium]|nr:1-acylglycerol-3-phosphate O-acyltransferase [Cyanobacteria bacterium GSL.Bin21]